MNRPVGHQGSWYAEWEGEKVPCIHRHPTLLTGMHYEAPIWDAPERHLRYLDDIRRLGKVVLTKSELLETGHYARQGYIALFRVENVELDAEGSIHLDLVERLHDFS